MYLTVICCFVSGSCPSNKASYVHYLVGFNITCTLYCLTLLLAWLQNVHVDIYDISGLCQHVAFLTHSSSFLYKWFLLFFCLDRCLVISPKEYPRNFCTRCKARCISLTLTCVAIIVFTNTALMEGVVEDGPRRMCKFLPQFSNVTDVLKRLDVVCNSCVPLALIAILMAITFWRLLRADPLMRVREGSITATRPFACDDTMLSRNKGCPRAGPVCGGCVDMRHSRHFFGDLSSGTRPCTGCVSILNDEGDQRTSKETNRRSVILALVLASSFVFLSGPHYILQTMYVFNGGRQVTHIVMEVSFLAQNIVENMAHSSYIVNVLAFITLDKLYRQQLRGLYSWFNEKLSWKRCYRPEEDVIDTSTPEEEEPL